MPKNRRTYDDVYDALGQSIAETGRPRKALAARIWPGRKLSTAEGLFSRAMSPENTDVNLTEEMVEVIMEETRPDDYIFYLCDKFGFERPLRKPAALENRLLQNLAGMQKQMADMVKELEYLRGKEKR